MEPAMMLLRVREKRKPLAFRITSWDAMKSKVLQMTCCIVVDLTSPDKIFNQTNPPFILNLIT